MFSESIRNLEIRGKEVRTRIGAIVLAWTIVFGSILGVSVLLSERASAGPWTIEDVAGGGGWSSIALDASGRPHISYSDGSRLGHAYWTGSAWNKETADSSFQVGYYTSIALDSSGHPHISHFDLGAANLKYTEWTGTAWASQTVDSVGQVGYYTSIDLDSNDYPHIAYTDQTNFDLKYARWTGTAWSVTTVDSAGAVGYFPSIRVASNNYPRISYYDQLGQHLKYAKWTGSAWSTETVDFAQNTGLATSLALDGSGYPGISYVDSTLSRLKYARWTGTAWSIQTIASLGSFQSLTDYTSIAFDGGGMPHISYYDRANRCLKYVRWTGIDWSAETVASGTTDGVGYYSSIAIEASGRVHIAYMDNTVYRIKHALINSPPNAPTTPSGPSSGDPGVTYTYSTSATDPNLEQVKYKFDWGDSTTSETTWVDSGTTANQDHSWAGPGTYLVKAMATDIHGATSAWSGSQTVMVTTKPPDAPTNLVASPGNAKISLSWSAPIYVGGSPITNYEIYRGLSPSGEPFLVEVGNVTSYTDPGLTNGLRYYYHVSAKNAAGEGLQTPEASAVPATVPSEPRGLQATGADKQITLTWIAPLSDGGSPIIHYEIYRGATSGGESFRGETGNLPTYVDSGLTNGQTYYYMVSAKNAVGEGSPSGEASAVPGTVPGRPTGLTATAGDGSVSLSWSAPVDNGGLQIVNYSIYRGTTSNGEVFLLSVGVVLDYADMGVVNGQMYFYRVAAVNPVGEGPASFEASATPAGLPSEPRNLRLTPAAGRVAMSWSAPSSDGGAQITGYKIYRGTTSGGETLYVGVGKVLTCNDLMVTNGQLYYYQVSAVNGVGEGPRSAEASVTPGAVPDPPGNLVAVAGNGNITLTWSPPASDGGVAISNYTIWRGTLQGTETFLATINTATRYIDAAVAIGQTYYYTVSARNAVGNGGNSTEASAIPITTPSEPLNLRASGGPGKVELTWLAPTATGGSPITNYRVYRGASSGSETLLVELGDVLTYTDSGATAGQTFYYRVSAVNAAGEGPKSSEAGASSENPSAAGQSILQQPWLWLVILVIVVVVAAVLAYSRKRGKAQTTEETTAQESEESEPPAN